MRLTIASAFGTRLSSPGSSLGAVPRTVVGSLAEATVAPAQKKNAANCLARISHQDHGLRGAVGPPGKERREAHRALTRVGARCGTSGKRLDAPCRPDSAALRVAPRRPPAAVPTPPSIQAAALRAASRASTVGTATLFGPLLADRTPGRDTGRDPGEKCGLAGAVRARPVPCSSGRHPRGLRTRCRASCGYAGPARPAPGCASGGR